MAIKKLKILLRIPVLLLSGLLFSTQPAYSAPVALEDGVMDQVTAGTTDSGGIVVGQNSETAVNRTTGLDLSGEAQGSANGLNIVNSTESAVANVANIWDGSGVTAADEDSNVKTELKINQVNNVTQEQAHSAMVSGYIRPEAEKMEIFKRSGNESHMSKVVNSNNTTDIFEETHISKTVSSAEVNTLLEFNLGKKINFSGNLGLGMAVAGHTETTFDGGSADIAVAVKGDVSAATDGMPLVADGKLVLVTRVDLPNIQLVMDGVGCVVAMGSCKADSTYMEITNTYSDNSTLDIIENHQSGQSSFSETQTSIHRSPFELKSARAEYIVIDDSTLELNSDVTLKLSDSAQKDTKGMNIVNAIGSNVANGTNLSRTRRFEGGRSKLVLDQLNIVHHGY